ncbi:MAG: BTAD domain-containing putative transcriptional regulator, partial [Acidimicrobiales bacterium]
MEVRLFGPFEVLLGDVTLPIHGAKQRALMAVLALQRGAPVSADRLIDLLWGDGKAANPANALQAQIRQLRRILGAGAISTTEAGYALDVRDGDLDIARFEELVGKGRRLLDERQVARASSVLSEALRLRRGEPLAEFVYSSFANGERARLEELTLLAVEARAGADLELGRHGEAVGELETLCREHPLRERLWELLILALYRDGRQAEALRAYAEARICLVDELGIEPGPALRQLEARVLAQDPSLAPPILAGPGAAGPGAATGNLRVSLSSFVGRDAERGQLRDAVRSNRLITLIGPGGVGKTRLAVEAAAALGGDLGEGSWLVELAAVVHPGDVAPAT